MRNIAINIRGQYREWDNTRHSLFSVFDPVEEQANVVYFFTTWDTSYQPIGLAGGVNEAYFDYKEVPSKKHIKETFGHRKIGGIQVISQAVAKEMLDIKLPEEYEQIMFIRHAANNMKKAYEKSNKLVFDIVIETRPDFYTVSAGSVNNIVDCNINPMVDFEVQCDNSLQRKHTVNLSSMVASSVYVNDLFFAMNSFTADLLADELMYAIENFDGTFFKTLAHDQVLEHMFRQKFTVTPGVWRYYADGELVRPKVLPKEIEYENPTQETLGYIRHNKQVFDTIRGAKMNKLKAHVVIPMAGNGSRFAEQGYTDPKPFINVNGKPMIERVVESVGLQKYAKHIFIVRKDQMTKKRFDLLTSLADDVEIVVSDFPTQGAAQTVLLAKDAINTNGELFIVNSDQLIDWDLLPFLKKVADNEADGCILCFRGEGTNWSYAATESTGQYVTEVAEKVQISPDATAGLYYFKEGSFFVESAEAMIAQDIRTNNEFYVAPVYNEFIKTRKATIFHCNEIHQLGTPIELEAYLANVKKN
jgi:dTDP-glucose pyrophosphorylase